MKYIDIFTTKYVINIANMMKILLEKMDYSVTLNVRSINIEDIKIVNQSEDRKMFIFCIQWLVNKDINLPKNKYIIYQLEQRDQSNDKHINNNFLEKLYSNAYHIFDYSKLNLLFYKNHSNVSYLLPPASIYKDKLSKKYDVLFCGNINQRRNDLLVKIHNMGINLKVVTNVFGENLLKLVSESKILLNIRYSDSKILEKCRLQDAIMSKGTYIISEYPGTKYDDINIYEKRIHFTEFDHNKIILLIKTILNIYSLKKIDDFDIDKINNITYKNLKYIF
jgi:hypothetical protein